MVKLRKHTEKVILSISLPKRMWNPLRKMELEHQLTAIWK